MIGRRAVTAGVASLGLAAMAAACRPPAAAGPSDREGSAALPQAQPAPLVLASFSILADIIRSVGGAAVQVRALVGHDRDSHHFDPAPSDLAGLAGAACAVRLGLGFDPWFDRALEAAGFDGPVVEAAAGLPLLQGSGRPDPHVWQSHANCAAMAQSLAVALGGLPGVRAAAAMADRAAAMGTRLRRALAAAREALPDRDGAERLAIVPHNSFAYLGAELGVRFLSLSALAPGSQTGAGGLARLTAAARASGAAVAFTENIADSRLMAQVAASAGIVLGGQLVSDALTGPAGPAPTLERLLAHNTGLLAAAFGGPPAASGG